MNKHVFSHFLLEEESSDDFGYLVEVDTYEEEHYPRHMLLKGAVNGEVGGCDLGEIQLLSSNRRVQLYTRKKLLKEWKEEKRVIALGRVDTERFFIGLQYGGIKIYGNDGELLESYLDSESVTNMTVDHEGGMWVSTLSSGVFYFLQ